MKTNRNSIHRASTKTISNPRSWIKFKADIVIFPCLENITKKSQMLSRKSTKESVIENHNMKFFLLFRFHIDVTFIIIDSLVITNSLGNHVKDFF